MEIYKYGDFNLYEWTGDYKKLPKPEYVIFLNKLAEKINKELLPIIPKQFSMDYNQEKCTITLKTDNKDDTLIHIELNDDKILYEIKPVKNKGIPYGFNYGFNHSSVDSIFNSIKKYFIDNEGNELSSIQDFSEKPTVTRKTRTTKKTENKTPNLIDMDVIRTVLEDAYILDEIRFTDITLKDLLKRMLDEQRTNTKLGR